MSDLEKKIKRKCLEAGFVKVGFARIEELKNEKIYLTEWLDENRNADMKWINASAKKRINPKLVLENAKSIISLAYMYDTPFAHLENQNIPKISRYAWGNRDYHKIIKKKLKALCVEIGSISPEIVTRYYVDDGPVMDKVWAARSGIGWMGKNTNIINPDIGSFFFLASVLINIELENDEPIEDLCKSCALCVNACPTHALYDEYKIDANLCISYHTIENRNEIPDEINLNGWIFGCDICQDVCPYNSRKIFTDDLNFYPKKEIFDKTYDEFLEMNEEVFNKTFEATPIKRTKYKGWKRNLEKAKEELFYNKVF